MESLRKLVGKVDRARDKFPKTLTVLEGLTNERNTWRLMGITGENLGLLGNTLDN